MSPNLQAGDAPPSLPPQTVASGRATPGVADRAGGKDHAGAATLLQLLGEVLNRTFLLRGAVTLLVLVALEVARALLGAPRGFLADAVTLYVAILVGGLLAVPPRGLPGPLVETLDGPVDVSAFLIAPLGPLVAIGVLMMPFSVGALELAVGVTVLGAAIVAILALLAATALIPAETWSAPPERNLLALVANGAAELAGTLFLPGTVAAAGYTLGAHLL